MVEITEAEETQPLISEKQQQDSPTTKRVTTKERDQLEVGDILDKYGLKSLYAFSKGEKTRGVPISFDGVIPQCVGNITFTVMDLGNNSFQGTIPNVFEEFIQLEGLILNGNQLKGGVPSSLSKCEFLGVLDLGNNHLNGTFPSWLGELCFPQVLVLKSNNFHGNIQPSFAVKFLFLCLRVLDLSHNGFVVTVLRDSDSVLVWPREETGDLSRVFERSNSTKCTISHRSEGEGEAGVWFKSKRIGNVAILGCCGCGLNDLRLSFEGKCSHGVMVFGENEHVLDGVWHCCLRLIVSFIRYRVMVSDINFAWYPRYLLFAFCIADVFQRNQLVDKDDQLEQNYLGIRNRMLGVNDDRPMRPDAKDVKLKLEPEGKFSFSAIAGADNVPYEIDVNLHDKVDVNESKSSVGSRSIVYHIKKEESKW
ncbi:leucine-rich repeat-containing protein [Tanacetum coccineum]|uniref:Leucine-rich repeat-containing protein n=1 Tax=Tanacetum coccineum TaxID=301880 RepID=A0ABQ5FF01_9ASTR